MNAIKETTKKLKITNKILASEIGYSFSAVDNASRAEKVSEPMIKACEMLIKIKALESELKDYHDFKNTLKNLVNN